MPTSEKFQEPVTCSGLHSMLNLLPKPIRAVALLALATGGPYLYFESDSVASLRQHVNQMLAGPSAEAQPNSLLLGDEPRPAQSLWSSWFGNPGEEGSSQVDPQGVPPGHFVAHANSVPPYAQDLQNPLWNNANGNSVAQHAQSFANPIPMNGGPIYDIREILRFDITPGWVIHRFSRVSTILAERNFDALRTPIVTGTQPQDLAGTLTYFFDAEQRLRRIHLQAMTGDPNPLVATMIQFYHLRPEPSLGGHLYTTRWNNQVSSLMHIAPAPVLDATKPNSRFVVFLEINQPAIPYGLSPEAEQLYRSGKESGRW